MIMEIKRLLVKIYLDRKKIIIQWIPAHVGIIGNELADMLAKEAMEIEEITELDLVLEEYISMIKRKIKEENLERWKSTNNFFVSLFRDLGKWRWISSGFRRCDVLISRMRSGTVGLNSFLYTIGLANSPDCIYCINIKETISHYLLSCPRHTLPRIKLFKRLNSIGIKDDTITLSLLLTGSDFSPGARRKIMMFLFDYFKDTDKLNIL